MGVKTAVGTAQKEIIKNLKAKYDITVKDGRTTATVGQLVFKLSGVKMGSIDNIHGPYNREFGTVECDVFDGAVAKLEKDMTTELDKANKSTVVGPVTVIEEFLKYCTVESSVRSFLLKKLPMEDYHFNELITDDTPEKGASINMADMQAMLDDFFYHKQMTCGWQLNTGRDIVPILDEYMKIKLQKSLHVLMKKLKHKKSKVNYVRQIVESAVEDASTWDGYEAAIKHWMWCVKRRASDEETVFHTMLVFTGGHGVGKSSLITRLGSIFADYILTGAKIKNITEERSAAIDSAKLIWIMNELKWETQSGMQTIKDWVDTEEMIYRPMRSNSNVSVRKVSMALASSNESLASVMYDPSGNRRFIDIPIQDPEKGEQFMSIFTKGHEYYEDFKAGGCAWTDMWLDIDENLDRGYADLAEKEDETVMAVESILNLNSESSLEYRFFQEVFSESAKTITISTKVFYSFYDKYARSMGHKNPKSHDNFMKDFRVMAKGSNISFTDKTRNGYKCCEVPVIRGDYQMLFKGIEDSVPGILKDNKHFAEITSNFEFEEGSKVLRIEEKKDTSIAKKAGNRSGAKGKLR